eukprot:2411987-Rhodomonas_salina.1
MQGIAGALGSMAGRVHIVHGSLVHGGRTVRGFMSSVRPMHAPSHSSEPLSLSSACNPRSTSTSFGRWSGMPSNSVIRSTFPRMQRTSFSTTRSMSTVPSGREKLRNIAVIAHVDHGKTTLVDKIMEQCSPGDAVSERCMDSLDLEQERGITIMAKVTSMMWKGTKLNLVDTPGHADFGGEVERVMSMIDGVLLLVDAQEGPMAQTKFVLSKALKQGITPIVVINKIDKEASRVDEVASEVFDLFAYLDANETQLDFPIVYASGRNGWADTSIEGPRKDMVPLLDTIIEH